MIPIDLVGSMVAHRVRRYRHGDMEIELHDSAFMPAAVEGKPEDIDALRDRPTAIHSDEDDTCACGHLKFPVEHGSSLCLVGCPPEMCARVVVAPEKEADD